MTRDASHGATLGIDADYVSTSTGVTRVFVVSVRCGGTMPRARVRLESFVLRSIHGVLSRCACVARDEERG